MLNQELTVPKMTWYIYLGEDLKRDQKIRFSFNRTIPIDYEDSDLIFLNNLIESESKCAPDHPDHGVDTKINCTCRADLRSIDKSLLKKVTGDDNLEYFRVYFDLVHLYS